MPRWSTTPCRPSTCRSDWRCSAPGEGPVASPRHPGTSSPVAQPNFSEDIMSRAFESEGSDFEFNPEMGEFDEAEFGEAEFDEAEFDEAETRDHRRGMPP